MKRKNLYTDNGEPRRIRCYMIKREPRPLDYITVVFTYASKAGYPVGTVVYRGMSANPCHPLGFGQWGEHDLNRHKTFVPGGSRVKFSELPEECKQLVRQDYEELWRTS